jgi:hypothetical protein
MAIQIHQTFQFAYIGFPTLTAAGAGYNLPGFVVAISLIRF